MRKKLTAQGPKDRKSYTVTLPKGWVKEIGLDKTKELELEVVGRKVILSQDKDVQERVVVNTAECNKCLIKVLQELYRIGISEIKFTLEDISLLEEITKIVNENLIGFEIIEQKEDFIVVKDITKESEESFHALLRRIFLLIIELSDSKEMIRINSLNMNIKRLINYCQRILIKKGHADYMKIPVYYLFLDQLEKITDELRWVLKLKLPDNKQKILDEIKKLFRQCYELSYKFDLKKYNASCNRTYTLKNEIKKLHGIDRANMHLHNISRLMNSLYGNIFALQFKSV